MSAPETTSPRQGEASPTPFGRIRADDVPGWIARSARLFALVQLGLLALLPPVLVLAGGLSMHAGPLDEAALARLLPGAALVGLGAAALALLLWFGLVRHHVLALGRAEQYWRTTALVDPLTGLSNRDGLRARLQNLMPARRRPRSGQTAVLVIDLDRFRLVNDSLGQAEGDALLRAVAARLAALTGPRDVAARLGADQFALLCPTVQGAPAAAAVARNALRALQGPLGPTGRTTLLSASIGVALADGETESPDALLTRAEAALRAAKTNGGSQFRIYEASMHIDAERRLSTEVRLRGALKAGQFRLVYQPVMAVNGVDVVAVEALLRWHDPQHGIVPPAEFIPVLEQSGLIADVGRWVLEEACRRAARWQHGSGPPPVLSVNVSPLQFAQADFVVSVQRALAHAGLPACQLQLEVTEGLLLDPTAQTLQKINELADAGIKLAIDDFGMGYSSLAYLRRFRLHTLKIDREFVRDATGGSREAAIVRAIVELGHALGLQVTAEGVETEAQHALLAALGCDTLQGFLFMRPMELATLEHLLGLSGPPRQRSAPVVLEASIPAPALPAEV